MLNMYLEVVVLYGWCRLFTSLTCVCINVELMVFKWLW